ncbi:hypothetical protein HQ576_19425, partial [bacterium]|nr:hypothetical protein [bacterium]
KSLLGLPVFSRRHLSLTANLALVSILTLTARLISNGVVSALAVTALTTTLSIAVCIRNGWAGDGLMARLRGFLPTAEGDVEDDA